MTRRILALAGKAGAGKDTVADIIAGLPDNATAVITDCRFANEVRWVKRQGGQVWWVARDGVPAVRAHASEGAIGPMDCDRTIANLGTLDDLDAEVERAWEQHLAAREAMTSEELKAVGVESVATMRASHGITGGDQR